MPVLVPLALGGMALLGAGHPAVLTGAATPAVTGSGPSLVISSPTVTGPCASSAGQCTSLTLPARGPLASTFDTPTATMVLTNLGTTAVTEGALSMSATVSGSGGSALEKGINVCIRSGSTVIANGPLVRGLDATPSVVLHPVTLRKKNGASNTFEVSFYAGEDSACGHVVSTDPTAAATWSTPAGGATPSRVGTGTYVTPPSLDNPAEGGTVTVTIGVDLAAIVTTTGPVTKGSTGTGTGSGSTPGPVTGAGSIGGPSKVSSGPSMSPAESLAFTGFDVLLVAGTGALLLLSGVGLLAWRRRLDDRR